MQRRPLLVVWRLTVLGVYSKVESSKKHLNDQLVHKFSGPQLVNNFGVHIEPAFAAYV
jgi:hypothetical protein